MRKRLILIPLYALAFALFIAVFWAGMALLPENGPAYAVCGFLYAAALAIVIKEFIRELKR